MVPCHDLHCTKVNLALKYAICTNIGQKKSMNLAYEVRMRNATQYIYGRRAPHSRGLFEYREIDTWRERESETETKR